MPGARLIFGVTLGGLLLLPPTGPFCQADEEGPASISSLPRKVDEILERAIEFNPGASTLRAALTDLAATHGFELRLNEDEIAAGWISLDEPLSLSLGGYTIRSVLRILLHERDLEFRVDDDTVVIGCMKRPRAHLLDARLKKEFPIIGMVDGVFRVDFRLILDRPKQSARFEFGNASLRATNECAWRRQMAEQAIFSVFSRCNTKEKFTDWLQILLTSRIDDDHSICGLTDRQREKLQLAGHGDIERVLDQAGSLCEQFADDYKPGYGRVDVSDEFLRKVQALSRTLERGTSGPESIYFRFQRRLLTSAQNQKLLAVSMFREAGATVKTRRDQEVGVREIHLSTRPIADDLLPGLTNIPELGALSLDATQVADDDLRHLKPLQQLTWLDLHQTRIGDEGMKHVAELERLERLEINGTLVTDAGLEHLVSLKNLKLLDVSETAITPAGIARLRAALPNVSVID